MYRVIKDNQQLRIELRPKNRGFSPPFLLALSIAIGLHLSFFLLFKIERPSFLGSSFVFEPVEVFGDPTPPLEILETHAKPSLIPAFPLVQVPSNRLPPISYESWKKIAPTLLVPFGLDSLDMEKLAERFAPSFSYKLDWGMEKSDSLQEIAILYSKPPLLEQLSTEKNHRAVYEVVIGGETQELIGLKKRFSTLTADEEQELQAWFYSLSFQNAGALVKGELDLHWTQEVTGVEINR